jgi:hypothetical protein
VTRRLLLALVGTAATVLVVAGLGTLLLARSGARSEARAGPSSSGTGSDRGPP